jgi:predicted Ser/Thr protein kinase
MMSSVEKTLGVTGKRDDVRAEITSRIGAWSVDHPGQKLDLPAVFPRKLATMREAYFEQAMKAVRKTNQDLLVLLTDGAEKLPDKETRSRTEATMARLEQRGYCRGCAREIAGLLARHRYAR